MFKTTKGNASTLNKLYTLLSNGAKLYVHNLDREQNGVVVSKDVVKPANYKSRVVYWLSNFRQDALFVPTSKCLPDSKSYHLYMLKNNEAILVKDNRSIISLIAAGYKLVVPLANPGFGSIVVNSIMQVSKSIVVAQQPYMRSENKLVHVPLTDVIFEDNEMEDLSAILFGEDLYAVAVVFKGSNQRYTYKSTTEYKPGSSVVVDTPSNGLQVVTVVDCQRGLSLDTNFQHYKWVVCEVDISNYNRLKEHERQFIEKAKLAKKKRDAIAKLAELGVTPEEFKSALGL